MHNPSHGFIVVNFVQQHLPSSLGHGEALSGRNFIQELLERHHVSKCNLITTSPIEYFLTRESSILNLLFLFFQEKKKFKYRYNLSSVFWNLIYITFKPISR